MSVALSDNLFTPDIIIPGVLTAGDNFNITCRLDGVVERLVGTLDVFLSFITVPGGGLNSDQYRDGLAYIRSHFLNPGMTGDSGTYRCRAFVINSFFFVSLSSENLQIKSW